MSSALDSELDFQIQNYGMPPALPNRSRENSREEEITGELNVLQKHVAYFDKNHDGIIYPWETYTGFRAIGCGVLLSAASAILINLALSRRTLPQEKFSSLLLPIYVENIHNAKHGSDSGVYDSEGRAQMEMMETTIGADSFVERKVLGSPSSPSHSHPHPHQPVSPTGVDHILTTRFVPSKFEDIFRKHARTNQNALTSQEVTEMLKANREPQDYRGWLASWTEWKILFFLCKDKDGLLHKETIRAVYDGSLFEQMEKERASRQKTS